METPDRLVYDLRRDFWITLAAGTGWIVSEAEKPRLAPTACHWCDQRLNGFDAWGRRTFRWQNTRRAAALSSATAFVAAPAIAYGVTWSAARHEGRAANAGVDAILITQAMAIASDATDLLKFTTGRARPYLHPPLVTDLSTLSPADNNTSFPSGHTTLAFSVVTSAGEIASLRGYRYAPWIWRAGLPLATLTAYLRVAADRHYLTDVLAGAGVGAGVGFAIPYFGHRRRDARVPAIHVAPTAGGGKMLIAEWQW